MNHVINTPHGKKKTILVPNVPKKVTKSGVAQIRVGLHLRLFPLVSGINDQAAWPVPLQNGFDELLPEGSVPPVINIDLSLSMFNDSLNQFHPMESIRKIAMPIPIHRKKTAENLREVQP